jgi:hypothetical protein
MPDSSPAPSQYLIDSIGQVQPVHPNDVAGAVALGWVPASDSAIKKYQAEQKYGTTTGEIEAGLAGVARGATLGLSDVALTKSGLVNPETLKGLQEVNPTASGAGELTGTVAPLILSGGTSVIAKGSASLAPNLIAKAGKAVGAFAEKAAAKSLGESTIARQVLSKSIQFGAAGATEGALYGTGHVVSESALGDPALAAESALSEIGLTAALMGGLGAGGGALSKTIRSLVPRDTGEKLIDWLGEFAGERNIKAAGAIQSDIKQSLKAVNREHLNELGQQMGELGLVTPLSGPEETLEKALALKDKVGEEMHAFTHNIDEKLKVKILPKEIREAQNLKPKLAPETEGYAFKDLEAKPKTEASVESNITTPKPPLKEGYGLDMSVETPTSPNLNVKKIINSNLENMRSSILGPIANNPGKANYLNSMTDIVNSYELKIKAVADSDKPIQGLHNIRRQLDQNIKGLKNVFDPLGNEAKNTQWKIRRQVTLSINEIIDKLDLDLPQWKNLNRVYEVAAQAEKFANAGLNRIHGNNFISPMEAIGAMSGFASHGAESGGLAGLGVAAVRRRGSALTGSLAGKILRNLGSEAESVTQKTLDASQTARAAGFDLELKAGSSVPVLASLEKMRTTAAKKITDGIARFFSKVEAGASKALSVPASVVSASSMSDAMLAAHQKKIQQIQELVNNPAKMHDLLVKQSQYLQDHAPNIATQMTLISSRAITFLASKLPQHEPRGLLAEPIKPSVSECRRIERLFDAVENPLTVLKRAKAGIASNDEIEAIKTVYPALLGEIQKKIVELAANGRTPDYQHRLALNKLMNTDLDGSSRTLAANQQIFNILPVLPGKLPKVGKTKLGLSGRAESPLSALSRR